VSGEFDGREDDNSDDAGETDESSRMLGDFPMFLMFGPLILIYGIRLNREDKHEKNITSGKHLPTRPHLTHGRSQALFTILQSLDNRQTCI
jgi:hypothetical protein